MHASTAPPRYPLVMRLLINRNFALLWSGQAVSRVGDFVFDTTLILWIALGLAAGKSWAPLAVSGVLIAVAVPSFVLGPIAGVFVDRWDKRGTMLVMDALRAVLVGALIPVAMVGGVPTVARLAIIYAVVALATVCAQFFEPARMALIGDVVTETERSRAGALGQVTAALAAVIGPPLAPILLVNFGARWALAINALSFAISFVAILAVRAPEAARSLAPGETGDLWREFVEGVRFFATNRVLMTILVAGIIVMLGTGMLNVLDVFFVTHNLHGSPTAYGLISGTFAAGALVGAIAIGAASDRIDPAKLLWLGLVLGGIVLVIYSRMTSIAPAAAVIAVGGLVISGVDCAIMPLILRSTPREFIGRVGGVINPAMSLTSVVSMALAAVLAGTVMSGMHVHALGQTFGPVDTLFGCSGIAAVLSGLYAMVRLRHDSDSEEPSSKRPEAVVAL